MSDVLEAPRLTPRETEILKLIAAGKTSNEIAIILSISYITVNTHKKTMMTKAGVYKETSLLSWAFRSGTIE